VQTPRLFKTASFRLTALYSGAFLLSFGLLLFLTYFTLTTALREQIRATVVEDLAAISAEATGDDITSVVQDIEERMRFSVSQSSYLYLADRSGHKIAGNLDAAPVTESWSENPFLDFAPANHVLDDDDDHQLWGQGKRLGDGSYLFVGVDAYRVLSAQETIFNTFLGSASVALLLATLAGTLLSQGFLRRIDAINRTSKAIMEGRLKERIPERGTSDEIDRLSLNLNKLFDSNQALLESLKQVTTDIAHDLRTPLSRLRQGLEEARASSADSAAYGLAIDRAITDADQLLSTFAALLRIAQIESGSRKAGFRLINLSEIVERLTGAYVAVAEDQEKELRLSIEPDIKLQGDGDLLLQMTANLLENAIRHTPTQSLITVSLSREASGIVLVVADTGAGISPDMHAKVFERFYRLEGSRTTAGNGLGLALVAAIADLHGIKVALEDDRPGLRVVLRFPPP
jgi:signal transduction histidine kinase